MRQGDLISYNTNLNKATFREADLSMATFQDTTFNGANFEGALIGLTVFANVDLSQVRNLDRVSHVGPSTIGIDTIYRSQGNILDIFLREAGVPDIFITYAHSLVGKSFDYYSCFISYTNRDQAFARRLFADLQSKGARCWFAPHDMHIGDKIRSRIDEAIHLQDKLLLILSEHSVASDWVEHEVEAALARERREKRTILFPIRLDDAILDHPHTGWAAMVQNERHIGDFTGWKDHDRYQAAFERLIRDLKKADK